MKVSTVGIDLAKNVFQLRGVNEFGKTVIKKQLRRDQMSEFFVNLPACWIGMEACGSAHYWARKLRGSGHTVKLMAPQFVKPYVKTNKNDAADAQAICEAVSRPNMRFVPIKNVEQQAVLALHRVSQGFVKTRTAQANQIRGLLGEFGLIIPQGIGHISDRVPALIEDASNELPGSFHILVQRLLDHLKELDRQVGELEVQIQAWHRNNDVSCKLAQIPGIGPITVSALVASIGDAKNFDSGRQVAAWLGLVPKQHSSGGKQNLLGMSKHGDTYLRTLLIHGARSVIYRAGEKPDACSWINGVVNRRNKNVAAVALANKNARIVLALLAHGRQYETGYARDGDGIIRCGSKTDNNSAGRIEPPICSGDHEVMAKQVRPWLAKPVIAGAPRVRVSDRGVNQRIPLGTVTQSHTKSPNVRVQSLPSSHHELKAWQIGGAHVRLWISIVESAP